MNDISANRSTTSAADLVHCPVSPENLYKPTTPNPRMRMNLFAGVLLMIIWIWGWLLPRASQSETVQKRVKLLNEAGINSSAFFYSDHPGMDDIQARIEKKMNRLR